jgi:superfamily I DNA/RNA helicase/RecB family exonuclease
VLDAAQRRVVRHHGGPLLVLAGPGTGKTTTLVEAAVARVEAGVPVEHLLLLTFSRRAAAELRDRVTARLGRTVREPVARTLHSYAFGILRLANASRDLPPPRLLAGPEQDVVVRELLDGAAGRWPQWLRPALRTRAFAGELRDLLMRAVERGLDGAELARLGERAGRPEWQAAGDFLTEYAEVTALRDAGSYGPAELVRSALGALSADPDLLTAERARRRRIFVDEYQDTDPAQADLLELLARGADEVVLVGDPDQSIYAFRGADDAALRDVDARFGRSRPVPTVSLQTSRRSGPVLIEATRRVAARLPGRAEHRLLRPGDPGAAGSLRVELYRSAGEEAAAIAAALRAEHLDGTRWSHMAVLVRSTTSVLALLRRALVTAGVPVRVRGEDVPLAEQPAAALLLDVVRCAVGLAAAEPVPPDDDVVERLLLGPVGGGDVLWLQRLRRALADEPVELARIVLDARGVELLPARVRGPVQRVATALEAARAAVLAGSSVEQVLWAAWEASGLARRWQRASADGGSAGAAADRDLDAVVELFEAAARYTDRLPHETVAGFLRHLAAQQIPGDSRAADRRSADAVSILTAHASKGLEWDVVCVAHVQEGTWPDLRRRGSLLGSEQLVDLLAGRSTPGGAPVAPVLAEERRLFYVAATRARRALIVTAVSGEEEQPSRFLDELDPVDGDRPVADVPRGLHLPALVADLRAEVCDPAAAEPDRRAAAAQLARLAAAGVRGAAPQEWWGLAPVSTTEPIADPARPVPVSPSRIEAYLRCELRALLCDVGFRDGDQLSASFGTVLHDVAARAPADATLDDLVALLDERWHELDFPARWQAANERDRARALLARLTQWLADSRGRLELQTVEQEFSVPVGDAVITGRVDRLERDRLGRLVVVDLKTGKTKPKDAELAEHPQLGAYQVAVEAGAFGSGERSGGALLVQLGAGGRTEQPQQPLSECDDPDWARRQVSSVAAVLRGSSVTATENPACSYCDLVSCCPVQPQGRAVPQ